MKKLNIGSANDYREGFINVDFNPAVKADVYADLSKRLPFEDNSVDYIYASHIIEHFEKKEVFKIMEELHRICKPNAIIDIYVPHYTSILAFKIPYHYSYYGIDSFRIFEESETAMGERYSPARFKVLKQELHLVMRGYENFPILKYFKIFNFLFNCCKTWQYICERLFFPGFEEVYFKIQVLK